MAQEMDWSGFASRTEVPERYKWDLSSIYEDDEAFLRAFEEAQALPGRYAGWEPRATSSAAELLAYLRFDDEATTEAERLWNYVNCRGDEDVRVSRYQDLRARIQDFSARLEAACAWFRPALLALSDERLEAWFGELPELGYYRRALTRARTLRPHVLEGAQEALLAQAGVMAAQPGLAFSMLNDADLRFPDALDAEGRAHAVTHGSFISLEREQDRVLRENAYHSVYGSYDRVRNTSAALLAAQMRQLSFFSNARHYASTLEASLAPTEVPTSVYGGLIDAVHDNIGALHSYMELRQRVLGLSELRPWDAFVPLTKAPAHSYSFEEACELMLAALAPLGEDYLTTVRRAIAERWYDVCETPGKASGAYSAGGRGVTPVMLLNFQGTLDDVFTLVHETGHSLHSWLSGTHQGERYAQYEMFVAEVASTTNECLLMHYLLDHASGDAERAYLLDQYCGMFKSTLFRQTQFAEFERDVNAACAKGEGMGADALSERYRALNDFYYGPAIISDGEIALEWARIPHFYYNYYVYVYATSFAAAVALSDRIIAEGEPATERYLGFLSGGCSRPPLELLAGAGVDLSGGAAVRDALAHFASLVDELGALM